MFTGVNVLASREELENRAKAVYDVSCGCVCLAEKDGNEARITGKELQERLYKLFVSEDLVTNIRKTGTDVELNRQILGQGISSRAPLEKRIEVFQLSEPINMDLEYSSEILGPEIYKRTGKKRYMKAKLFYDGFLYFFAIDVTKMPEGFYYRDQVKHLQDRLLTLLAKEDTWTLMKISPSPNRGNLKLYLLEEPVDAENEGERDLFDMKCETASRWGVHVSYIVGGQPLDSAADFAMDYLLLDLRGKCKEFYYCHILSKRIESETSKAREIIGNVTSEVLNYHDIKFLKVWKRMEKCREIGKDLAYLYAIMPQIEKLENECKHFREDVVSEKESGYVKSYSEMIGYHLPIEEEMIFTQNVREMLRQDVSEIRAQLNYQVLLISAFLTFIAVILGAVVGIFT